MNEQIQTIIDRARALLAAATPGPWEVCPDTRPDVRTTCNTGGFLGCGHIATVSRYDANEADAALIAAAPGLLATLCDAMEAAERRAEEAEAQAAAMRDVLARLLQYDRPRVCGVVPGASTSHCRLCGFPNMEHAQDCPGGMALASNAGRALLDRLHAAEARVAEVEAAQKMRAESADPDDETWHTRAEYLRRVKAEARVADLENVRVEQAAKLRRHLDEIAELRDRAGIAEGREAAAKANAEQMAGWLDARNAGLVQMARERDALREKLAALKAKAARLKAPTAKVCRCVNTTYSFDPARAVVLPLAGYSITAGVGCPSCGGSGAVIVETASGE